MKRGRVNQKARTRASLLQAAAELMREGRSPSMQEAADRALVSVATAYRYFPSAEDLWWEASTVAVSVQPVFAVVDERIDAAGPDAQARLEAVIRSLGFEMLDDQVPYRRLASAALERWFRQADAPGSERTPIREGRRNEIIASIVDPLRGEVPDEHVDRIAHVLGLVVGTDAMIALIDGVALEVPEAKRALLDAGRWLLAGALAEFHPEPPPTKA